MNGKVNNYEINVLFKNGIEKSYVTEALDKPPIRTLDTHNQEVIFNNGDSGLVYIRLGEVACFSTHVIKTLSDQDILSDMERVDKELELSQ